MLNRKLLTQFTFAGYFILLLWKTYNAALISQAFNPVLTYPGLNITYWIPLFFNFHKLFFESYWLSIALDITLFVSCLCCIIFPKKVIYPRIFVILIYLYHFLYTQFLAYQPYAIGLLIPCIPFIFEKDYKFKLAFEFGRYVFCGLYFLSGILKLYNGAFFHANNMSASLKATLTEFLQYNSSSSGFRVEGMEYLISHSELAQLLFCCATLLELSFLVGFITKKFDWLLAVLFLFFHFSNSYLLDIPFANHAIILVLLIKPKFEEE